MRWTMLVVVTAIALAGCAAHRPTSLASRFVHRGESSVRIAQPPRGADQTSDDSLATFIEKVRVLSAAARPAAAGTAPTIEATNDELRAALANEAAQPTAETHRLVGSVYAQMGVLDLAYERFAMAVRLDHYDAASYEQMARIWRDWGFPHLGLGDAYRAIYYAPSSPSAYNTLGTVFQALERPEQALAAYRRALGFAPDAAYALNNVCSALLAMGKGAEALPSCERAARIDPALAAAQRNLAAAKSAVESAPPGTAGVSAGQHTDPGVVFTAPFEDSKHR